MKTGPLDCLARRLIAVPGSYRHESVFAYLLGQAKSYNAIDIWSDGEKVYYSNGSAHYERQGNRWVAKTWEGLSSFSGRNVWTDGTNVYYSAYQTHYKLNSSTKTWEVMSWTVDSVTNNKGYFYGYEVWSDGTTIYAGAHHKLSTNNHWVSSKHSGLSWNYEFYGKNTWSDGTNIYLSNGANSSSVYKLNGTVWERHSIEGFSEFYGQDIWTDGTDFYYSHSGQNYKLVGGVWMPCSFGSISFLGRDLWTDGKNILSDSVVLIPTKVEKTYVRANNLWKAIEESGTASSMLGTWLLNTEIHRFPCNNQEGANIDFTCTVNGTVKHYNCLTSGSDATTGAESLMAQYLAAYNTDDETWDVFYRYDTGWVKEDYRTINVTEEPTLEQTKGWLLDSGKRQ